MASKCAIPHGCHPHRNLKDLNQVAKPLASEDCADVKYFRLIFRILLVRLPKLISGWGSRFRISSAPAMKNADRISNPLADEFLTGMDCFPDCSQPVESRIPDVIRAGIQKNQSDNSLKSKYPAEMECSGFFSSDRNRIPNECGIPDLIRTGIQKFRINKTLPANIPPSLIFGNFVSCFYPIDAEFRMVAEFRMSTEFRMDLIRQGFSLLFF